jgi:hypothetical protein
MKPARTALLKEIDALAVKLGHKQRPWLRIIVVEGENPQPEIERALAEWHAEHPRAKKRTVDDFEWIVRLVAKQWVLPPEHQPPGASSPSDYDVFADEEERRRQFRRRLHYPPVGLV